MKLQTTIVALYILALLPSGYSSGVACSDNSICENTLRVGSECLDGFCTNPFFKEGCLKKYLPDWHKIRVCNSHDPADAEEKGFCVSSAFDYLEIRALSQTWESSYMATWILQIILSEILDVPTSVEIGLPNLDINFYDRTSRFDYGLIRGGELPTGNEVVDCRKVLGGDSADTYRPCANAIIEGWWDGYGFDFVERLSSLGTVVETHWWIPKFTAEKDPTLVSYFGLSGDENRRKLAETFKRPTTWKSYCEEVSVDGCASGDDVAARAPENEFEEESMFVEGLYIGHFRATDENDCDSFPDTCTGHIADYPCEWMSYVKQQTYHLGIALKSSGSDANDGYTYSQLTQIWNAANATKSDVMMRWWTPQILHQRYAGSDAEFTKITLPPATQQCEDARAHALSMCGDNETEKIGEPEGACDWPAQVLVKLVTASLREATLMPDDQPALWNPAYDTISNLELSNLHFDDIFQRWFSIGIDEWGFDLRDATCSWVVDNLGLIESFIPPTFPRSVQNEDNSRTAMYISAQVLAAVSTILVLFAIGETFWKRRTKTMYYMQVDFMCMILFGLLLISAGSMLTSLNPTDAICITSPWLENIGNVFVLVPLAMRVSAIGQLATAGKQMQRVRLRRRKVQVVVGLVLLVVSGYMLAWTLVDPLEEKVNHVLSEDVTPQGEYVVYASAWCESEEGIWSLLRLLWQLSILFPAIVVAAVASKWQDVNDTRVLGITLTSRMIFALAYYFVGTTLANLRASDMRGLASIILSVDTIVTVCAYLLPKLAHSGEDMENDLLPDLFLHTTIMIASIDGFTAWSSVREPTQVFKFLEALYESFDEVAERHRIFKAETSGEYYVGAAGVPESRPDHAVAMAKFASDCLKKMDTMSKKLEVRFGPDTSDLSLRIGMHSGPVTGGFVAGKQSRFQLFGDTMSTARLMHESGERGRIHLSELTASLLIQSGKNNWVEKLPGKILTAEKGELQTYWLNRYRRKGEVGSVANSEPSQSGESDDENGVGLDSERRWIEWNTEVLSTLLKKVVARRQNIRTGTQSHNFNEKSIQKGEIPLEEVQEIIELPGFDREAVRRLRERVHKVQLNDEVVNQLREYVTQVANLYCKNPFHNFSHASYVVMAVTKYMNRIISAADVDVGFDAARERSSTHEAMHDHTYGITSDPLTQFACVFSALIHDIDHPGVPNTQLIKENERLAAVYKNRSVAEQRSFDLAWDLLMEPTFDFLRGTLCDGENELRRFRQLVINSVMATDLGDKELKELRNARWSKAFNESADTATNSPLRVNRKATIVIEHLIQAADVAHTCQHWNIYRKWNERLFEECYEAYRCGRAEKNPADYWYEGEIGFFDFYIIPLSKKLRDCGVFGPTSDENLNYAQENRALWVKEGRSIVASMLDRLTFVPTEKDVEEGQDKE